MCDRAPAKVHPWLFDRKKIWNWWVKTNKISLDILGDNQDMNFKQYYEQGSVCETRKGPNRPPIQRGIDYLVYAYVWENQTF